MNKYNNQEFKESLLSRINGRQIICPICGGTHFSIPEQMSNIFIGDNFDGIQIGQSIPCGMIICEQCGHIHFFALGALGLLPHPTVDKDEK